MVGETPAIHMKERNSGIPEVFKTSKEAFRILSEARICRIKPTFPDSLFFLPFPNSWGRDYISLKMLEGRK